MIRAFLALPLPEPLSNRLSIVQHGFRLARPVPRENFHATLVFLDEQPEPVLEELHLALEARALPRPKLQLDGLGVFGGAAPRNLHARLVADAGLVALQARVAQITRRVGIRLEARKFVPHVTLARFARDEVSAETLAAGIAASGVVSSAPVPVPEMILYRSTLRAQGAEYDPLAAYPLTG